MLHALYCSKITANEFEAHATHARAMVGTNYAFNPEARPARDLALPVWEQWTRGGYSSFPRGTDMAGSTADHPALARGFVHRRGGVSAAPARVARLPETRILFLTSYADNRFVLAAMEAGADGYLLKESGTQRIVDAIHTIREGGTVFDPVVTREVMTGLKSGNRPNPLQVLSAQEWRVLEEVAKGKTDKEVAVALEVTSKTARNYLDRIFTKLNVHTRTEAAMLYTRFREKTRLWD